MKTIALRDLQMNGAGALEGLHDLALVRGRNTSFFLVLAQEGMEGVQASFLERGMARAALLHSQLQAMSTGLNAITMEEITEEVKAVRRARVKRRRGKS